MRWVVMIALVATMVMAQSPPPSPPAGDKCAPYVTCSSCVGQSGCGWCSTPMRVGNATQPKGCVKGTFGAGSGCSRYDYYANQCKVVNMWLILVLVGIVVLVVCCCCTWLYWVCHKRQNAKTKRLLNDYDEWVDHLGDDNKGAVKTNARRQEMKAKYGHLMRDDDGVPLR